MKAMRLRNGLGLAAAALLGAQAGGARAAVPQPWEMWMQPAATPVMERIREFHGLLMVIVVVIAVIVTGLMLYTIWRFSAKRNPVPQKTTHNTLLEMIWTVVPVIILVIIAVPSFKLLYYEDVVPKADLTIKAIGNQWYWSYEYPDNGKFGFDAVMVPTEELKPGQLRLLETDNEVVLPVDTTVRIIVTASDVLHSWAVPAFGVKIDAIPGRLNETWVRIEREGTYYGQCSELCGVGHAFMPIKVRAVSKETFAAWVKTAQKEFAAADVPAAGKLARLEGSLR